MKEFNLINLCLAALFGMVAVSGFAGFIATGMAHLGIGSAIAALLSYMQIHEIKKNGNNENAR